MFFLTYQERKAILILSGLLLLGAVVKVAGFEYSGHEPADAEIQRHARDKININTAGSTELISIPGIGEKTAERIIDYRRKNGNFKSARDLTGVKGIGPKKAEIIRPYVEF